MGPVVPLMLTMIPLEELLKKLLGILQASDEGRMEELVPTKYRPSAPEVFIPQSARAVALPQPASASALAPRPPMH